jgi:hypothetical protein
VLSARPAPPWTKKKICRKKKYANEQTINHQSSTTVRSTHIIPSEVLGTMKFPAAIVTSLVFSAVHVTAFGPLSSLQNTRYFEPLLSTPISNAITSNESQTQYDETLSKGAISMNVDELAEELGGWGRARLAWDYMRVGVDPLVHFREKTSSFTSTLETFIQGIDANGDDIQNLLPNARRTQLLGRDALDKLQELYGDYGGKLEGGVANLSHISTSSDGTTKLLIKLKDGLEVETVIIPWFDKGCSTLCIS